MSKSTSKSFTGWYLKEAYLKNQAVHQLVSIMLISGLILGAAGSYLLTQAISLPIALIGAGIAILVMVAGTILDCRAAGRKHAGVQAVDSFTAKYIREFQSLSA